MSTWTKFEKKTAMAEETMSNKTLVLFPSKNVDQDKTILNLSTITTVSEQNLATRLNMMGKL